MSNLRYFLSDIKDTKPTSLNYMGHSDDKYIIFDPDNDKKTTNYQDYNFKHVFTSTDELVTKGIRRKIHWHNHGSKINVEEWRELRPVVIFDCEENAVYEPQPYQPLPGKKIHDNAIEYVKGLEDFKDAVAKTIYADSYSKKIHEQYKDESVDLEMLQKEYIGLEEKEAAAKAEANGIEMRVSMRDGEWSYQPKEDEGKSFGVYVANNKVVAISHDSRQYSGVDQAIVSVWQKKRDW